MKWLDFSPYVLPYVIGCPDPTMEMHARLAAIEFFRRTLSWREVLDAVLTDGTERVELELPSGAQVIKIKSVEVAGHDAQSLRVKGAGLGEPVGLMVSQRVLKEACEGRGHGCVGGLGRARAARAGK